MVGCLAPIPMRTRLKHYGWLIVGLVLLVALSLAGGWIARVFALPIPGPVLGLACLLLLLALVPELEHWIAPACDMLLKYLGLFIVPAAVGLMLYQNVLSAAPAALLFTLTASTLITGVLAACLWPRAR
jgi:holin-like protein